MVHDIKKLFGSKLAARDGEIGHVKDFYFDDQNWVIRYLVADTGPWLMGRLVLLSPHALGKWDAEKKVLPVALTKRQIEDSPPIESHQPVSRQYEVEYYRYYGWPVYWEGGAMWGLGSFPVVPPPSKAEVEAQVQHRDDEHLQSMRAVNGYQIHATDGAIGTVTSFAVDDQSWAIHHAVVSTGHWYSGKEVPISTQHIGRISYEDSTVFTDLSQAEIQHAAENELAKTGT